MKVFELPRESVIKSPAGKLFVVTKCERQSPYWCIVSCKEKDDPTDSTMVHISWPSIGWMYSSVPGLEVQPPLTYIDQKFPSPLYLHGPINWSDDRILLYSRKYNDISCESFSAKRYYDLILAREQYMDLINFDHKTQFDSENVSISHAQNESCYEYKLLLLHNLFRNQQSSLNCVKFFQNDYLKMMNSTHTAVDEFILFPLCPRDEISYSGVLLTSINISTHLGLIEKTTNAKFKPAKNAHLRRIFQFGDVLTDERMANIDLRVLSHLTKIGHEDYVRVIYNSTKTYIKQHDYLHEIIHYLGTVFKVDYPGFLQPIQVLIGTKRIGIDPVKGKWRDHEYFIEKVLNACKHLRLVSFFRHHDQLFNSPLTGDELVAEIKRKYNTYCKLLEICPCEISRRVSLFIKRAQSWRRASDGVRKGDFILLEEETTRWIPIWKKSKKPYYYKAGLRRLETMNAMSPPEMELMRRNRFIRMSAGKHFISVDDFCEKHNLMQKDVTENDFLDNVVEQSKHLHFFRRCGDELFGVTHHKSTTIPSTNDDVCIIVSFLEKVGVFEHFSVNNKLNDNTFWEHVEVPKTRKGGAADVSKGVVPLDDYEENCRAVLLSWKDQEQSIPYKENNHAEDDTMLLGDADTGYTERITANDLNESDDENISDDICQDIEPDETRIRTVLTTVEEQTAVLKQLCKVHRYKTNDECLKDLYDGGIILMENVVTEQDTLHATIKREENLIHKAVSFFCKRMKTNMDEIKKIVEVSKQQKDDEIILSQWEVDYIKWSNEINH